jgi:hypothetical protein
MTMKTPSHILLGAAAGALAATLPDLALYCFGWRRTWLPDTHPLVRAHRVLHRPASAIVIAAAAGYASHLLADHFSDHRTGPS